VCCSVLQLVLRKSSSPIDTLAHVGSITKETSAYSTARQCFFPGDTGLFSGDTGFSALRDLDVLELRKSSCTLDAIFLILQHTAAHCNTLQHTATLCTLDAISLILQHTAVEDCKTMQHTATNRSTL